MATITRGPSDESVARLKTVLDAYENQHPGATASVYRHNSASVRLRIVDAAFAGWSKAKRHGYVWKFVADRLTDDELQEVSVLLLVTPEEQKSSFMNAEFDDPVPSNL